MNKYRYSTLLLLLLNIAIYSQVLDTGFYFHAETRNRFSSTVRVDRNQFISVGQLGMAFDEWGIGWISSYDSLGNQIFWKEYGEETSSNFTGIVQLSPDTFFVAGSIGYRPEENVLSSRPWLLQFDNHGDTLWSKTLTSNLSSSFNYVNSLILFKERKELLAISRRSGLTTNGINTFSHFLDFNGNIIRENSYYTSSSSSAGSVTRVIKNSEGGFALYGSVHRHEFEMQAMVINCNELGDTLWTKTFGDTLDDGIENLICTRDGGFIGTGYTNTDSGNNSDISLFKLSIDGDLEWIKYYGTSLYEAGKAIIQLDSEKLLLCSEVSERSIFDKQLYFICTDMNGEMIWDYTHQSKNEQRVKELMLDDSNSFYMIGYEYTSLNDVDAAVLKFSKDELTPITGNNQKAIPSQKMKYCNSAVHFLPALTSEYDMSLYTLQGREVLSEKVIGSNYTLPVLAKGVYLLSLKNSLSNYQYILKKSY